jgi:futalosine hydrolase
MHILMVFATDTECQVLLSVLAKNATFNKENATYSFKNLTLEWLIAGVGMTAACYSLTKKITNRSYDLIINVGIAGAFDHKVNLGSVFLVSKDRFADLGVEDAQGRFLDVYETDLVSANAYPCHDGWIHSDFGKLSLKMYDHAVGVTVNKVTGSTASINSLSAKYRPDIESMEGAACFYVAKMNDIPCLQLRSISNHVEPRDKSKWNIPLALKNLEDACFNILENISKQIPIS